MSKISVIVPVYRVEAYLERCVNSVLGQSFEDIELILVDDGSPDRCPQMCDEFAKKDSRIRVVHKENGGLSSARNAGLEVATSEYVFFLDSDDWINLSALEHMYDLAQKHNAQIVSGSYALVRGKQDIPKDKEPTVKVFEREEALLFYSKTGMSKKISEYPAWGKLYKKELFAQLRFPVGQLYEDVVTVFKLLKMADKYVKTSMPIYYYFQCDTSIVRSKFKMKDMDAILVGKQMVEEVKNESDKLKKYAYDKEARGYFSVLCKMGFYGISPDIENPESIIKEVYGEFKKGYARLMFSSMPLSRKVIATMFRVNCKVTMKILNKLSGGE